MVRSTKNAIAAAVRSKAMATAKTPGHPMRGSVYFAANGVHIVGTTVMATPYATRTIPMPNSRSCVFRFQSIRRMVGARKCEKNASAPPRRRSTSARKSKAFPAASADPIGTKTDAVPFAV